jgi:flavodoxin short chain
MKKIAVIYKSATGNTEMMAEAIAKGAKSDETEVKLLSVEEASAEDVINADAVALGCRASGAEEFDADDVVPFIETIQDKVTDKPMVLFGSFGWGDGQYMEEWADQMKSYGANLLAEGLTLLETPDNDGLAECEALGKKLQ